MKTTINLEEHNAMKKESARKKLNLKTKLKALKRICWEVRKVKKLLIRISTVVLLGITIKTTNMIMKRIFTSHIK